MSDAENELIETLKNIQDGHAQLQFAENALYLDADIIDLTVLPPPETPDTEIDMPRFGHSSSMANYNKEEEPPTPYREDNYVSVSHFSSQSPYQPTHSIDSARVVNDLDNLCETLSEMRSSPNTMQTALKSMPTNIDDFIASLSVPPPPTSRPPPTPYQPLSITTDSGNSVSGKKKQRTEEEEDIYACLIVPPPPPASACFSKEQDDVIAKFWRATDDVKKMCVPSGPGAHINGHGNAHHEHHQQQLQPQHCNDISPRLVREVHSSSSGDSGYDSIMSTNEWSHDCTAGLKFLLPTVDEGSTERTPSSMSEKSPNSESNHDLVNGRPVTTGKPPRAPKPPIPPGSPSIQERRKQLASKKANGQLPGPPPISQKPARKSKAVTIEEEAHESQEVYNPYEIYVQHSQASGDGSNGHREGHYSGSYDFVRRREVDQVFAQSQRDIDTLLSRLEEAHESRLQAYGAYGVEADKFDGARDALVNESRQFVTSSKLFVKCATESSPQVLEHLLECVALLERMYGLGELIVVSIESQAQVTCLVDRLKEVAATYAYTVDTVHKLNDSSSDEACDTSSSPYMGLLMSHATSLATALSALMRTLRALS